MRCLEIRQKGMDVRRERKREQKREGRKEKEERTEVDLYPKQVRIV